MTLQVSVGGVQLYHFDTQLHAIYTFLAGIAQGRAPVKNTAICSSKDRVTQQNHVNSQKFDIYALYNDKLRLTVISLINNPEKSLELFQKLNTPPKQVQKKSVVGRIKKKCLPQHTWASC